MGKEHLALFCIWPGLFGSGFDALRELADAVVYRNKIEVEVAKVFEVHFNAIHKTLLHTSGLIGLNTVEDEEREGLILEMRRNVSQVLDQLCERTGHARERSRENIKATKRLPVKSMMPAPLFSLPTPKSWNWLQQKKTALSDDIRVQILDINGQVMDIPCLNLRYGRLTH